MLRRLGRPGPRIGLGLVALATALGCAGSGRRLEGGGRTPEELRESAGWVDPEARDAVRSTVRSEDLIAWAEKARALTTPRIPSPKKTILVVSGGGVYGAYSAGVMAGWTQTGTRPEFDVVTGISTGALVGAFAFLGPAYDCELKRYYTTMRNEDIYRMKRFPRSLLSDSLADNAPLVRLIDNAITDDRIQAMAAEYRKGRRFYVGTSDLDTRRAVVWDVTAIAARNTPGDRELLRSVLVASASIPGFFPPVRIPVTVDGVRHVERHIDGGTSSSMFFAPPYVPPEFRPTLPPTWLHGSDLYILVAGKLYADPVPVKARSLSIAENAVSTIVYDQTRSDLHKLFLLSILTGMNYHVSSIPKDVQSPRSSTDFNPDEMLRLFEAGVQWAMTDGRWRDTPPGYEPGEGAKYRGGTVLTDTGRRTPVGGGPGGGPQIAPVDVPQKQ